MSNATITIRIKIRSQRRFKVAALSRSQTSFLSSVIGQMVFEVLAHNVSICVRAGLSKPRPVPDTERIKDTKTLDYASTPLDANTLLGAGRIYSKSFTRTFNSSHVRLTSSNILSLSSPFNSLFLLFSVTKTVGWSPNVITVTIQFSFPWHL